MNRLFVLAFITLVAAQSRCPTSGKIYSMGISEEGTKEVVDAHNKFRLKIARNQVPGQPKGTNLRRMSYDKKLEWAARDVSVTCELRHVRINDDRWYYVGQNLYISWSSIAGITQNWTEVVTDWFSEYEYFIYPTNRIGGETVGHYTQIVWADTYKIGCDFVAFHDVNQVHTPYAKLYTCNYGPGGNYFGEAPYEIGRSGCENLC